GRFAGRFQVDLKISDGLFFGASAIEFPLVNGDNTIEIPGSADTTKVVVVIEGARTNTQVWNKTNGIRVRYPRPLPLNTVATITGHDMLASEVVGGNETDTTYTVVHSGSPQWMILRPGTNIINLSSDSGAGAVKLLVQGAWT
ncbi:MAG: hypothetical protein RR853_09290, partial [Aurantimicrobium sp.]|uniref:hypothetical protein n=1 Tax=Aurantimicrobium sp. TaxID=1930784 RepID=UPI002FC96042